jgi:hypothetical protein
VSPGPRPCLRPWPCLRPRRGRRRLLERFDDPARQSSREEFATDGTHVRFTAGQPESDIWTMELGGR